MGGGIGHFIDYTTTFKTWKCTLVDLWDDTEGLPYRIWIYDKGRTTLSLRYFYAETKI